MRSGSYQSWCKRPLGIAALAPFDDFSALGVVPQVALQAAGYGRPKIGIVRRRLDVLWRLLRDIDQQAPKATWRKA